MDNFGTVTITLLSPYVDKVTSPEEISRTSRLWHKLTRKPLPTITTDVLSFYTMELTSDSDPDEFEESAETLEMTGYTVVSVIVDDTWTTEELVKSYRVPNATEISALVRGMIEDSYRPNAYVAYVLEYGWDADCLTESWMDDHYRGAWDSAGAYVEEFVTDCYSETFKSIPHWVDIDWDGTADNLSEYDFVRYYGATHVFETL